MAVSYPVVAYSGVGSARVGYVYVAETRTPFVLPFGNLRCPEMWRRTHRWGLTRGVAVDRMEVQQGERERKEPQWTSKSTSSRSSAATTPQTWRTSWKTSKADPKAPAPAGASPSTGTPPEAREGPSERRRRPRLGHPAGRAPEALRAAISKPEGRPRRPGVCAEAPGDGPEQLRNVGVAKIPELKM